MIKTTDKLMENIIEYYTETIKERYASEGITENDARYLLAQALQHPNVEEEIINRIDKQ